MITVTIICLIVFILCIRLVVFGAFKKDWLIILFLIIAFLSGGTSIILGALAGRNRVKNIPIEYEASKYTVEYKITKFQGHVDTTYVLVPKTE